MWLIRDRVNEQATAVLEIQHLYKTYPGFTLKDVNLVLKPGTITGLLGRNGAGKTTLIKCALGLIPFDSGSIKFHGTELKVRPRGDNRLATSPNRTRCMIGCGSNSF